MKYSRWKLNSFLRNKYIYTFLAVDNIIIMMEIVKERNKFINERKILLTIKYKVSK